MSSAELGIIGKQFCFVYFLFKGSVLGPLLFGTLHHWRTLSRWQSSILVVVPSFLFNNHLYADDTTFRLPSGCDSSVRLLTLRMHYNIFSWITSFHTTEFDSQIVYNWISLTDRGKLTQPFTYHYAQILVISKSKLEYVYVVFLFFSSCCYCHYYCYYYIVHLYSLSNNKIVCNALDAFLTDQECF